MSGILHALGSDTTLIARSGLLKNFDDIVKSNLTKEYERVGINLQVGTSIEKAIKKDNGLLTVTLKNGEVIGILTGF